MTATEHLTIGAVDPTVWLWIVVSLAVLLALGVMALLIVKWRFGIKRSAGTIDAAFGPRQLEQLHQAGQLTDAEYRRLRKATVAQAAGSAAESGDPSASSGPPDDGNSERPGE